MNENPKAGTSSVTRRNLLKAASAIAGVAAGSDAISGFPTIWAQDIKDITLRHIGVSYSVVQAIGDQASKDLGFKVAMQNLDTSTAITRFITQPNSVDIPDLEGWQAKVAVPRGHSSRHRGEEDHPLQRYAADLHQGRIRGQESLPSGYFAL